MEQKHCNGFKDDEQPCQVKVGLDKYGYCWRCRKALQDDDCWPPEGFSVPATTGDPPPPEDNQEPQEGSPYDMPPGMIQVMDDNMEKTGEIPGEGPPASDIKPFYADSSPIALPEKDISAELDAIVDDTIPDDIDTKQDDNETNPPEPETDIIENEKSAQPAMAEPADPDEIQSNMDPIDPQVGVESNERHAACGGWLVMIGYKRSKDKEKRTRSDVLQYRCTNCGAEFPVTAEENFCSYWLALNSNYKIPDPEQFKEKSEVKRPEQPAPPAKGDCWPKDEPLPELYDKAKKLYPCPKCRRFRTATRGQNSLIHYRDLDIVIFRCVTCGHRWKLDRARFQFPSPKYLFCTNCGAQTEIYNTRGRVRYYRCKEKCGFRFKTIGSPEK